MALKVLLCIGDDELPQHRSVLRAMNTLNSPKNYIRLLGGLSPIHSTRWRGAQCLMWGTRGSFLPAAAMVGYGCAGWCWLLETYLTSTYCRNSKNWKWKYFFYSYVDPIHSWHLIRQLYKKDLDLHTWAFGVGYMAWKWICISLKSRMVVLMESGTNTKFYKPVSQIACICVLFVLVLNIHIPLYLDSRGKHFFRTSKFFFFSSSFNFINPYKFFELPNFLFPVIVDSPFCVTDTD